MNRLTINRFVKGLNTDVDKTLLDPVFFTDAHNLEIVGNGNFFSLKNIKGTVNVQNVINTANTVLLGVFENFYKIGNTSGIKCLTIFTATLGGNFKIWCYDTENDALYELYEEAVDSDYFTDDRIVDGRSYAENNIDILEFTDNESELRQLRCEIATPYVANSLTAYDLSLLRRGANGLINLDDVTTGGSLISGTYQIAYRMVDTDRKRFTKWSSLTNPIHVYTEPDSFIAYAGIGLPTNSKIIIDIVPTDEELANFDKFQLAVVENIYPTGPETVVEGENQTFVASLLPVESVANRLNYEYAANQKIGTVPIEDIVVDLAPIKTAKTLSINQKKLFAANIKYHDLEFDNGEPVVGGGGVLVDNDTPSTYYYDAVNSSLRRGYFRDEVYRYGIVYRDRYGNKAPVKVLDLSALTDNQISALLPDFKFPSRSTSNAYSILDSNDGPKVLGLALTGIDNHPTWAVGFEIVRAKRIKKVMFQTPVIPMTTVEGIGAFLRYPSLANTTNDDEDTKAYPDAQPMTSSKVYVPKNLFWPEMRAISKRKSSVNGDTIFGDSNFNRRAKGESQLTRKSTYDYAIIFPQSQLYENAKVSLTGTEKLQTIDFCITRLDTEDFSDFSTFPGSPEHGNSINTKIAGNFYSLRQGDYFFDNAWTAKTITDADNQIVDNAAIDALSPGVILAGEKVLQYSELSTQGVNLGYEPKNQKMTVIKLSSSYDDEGATLRVFANGTHNAYASNGHVFDSSSIRFENDADATGDYTNLFATRYPFFSENSSYIQAIRIANVVRGEIGDDRYGDISTQHEFISTGAKYAFSTAELIDVAQGNSVPIDIDVWGGDCFVSPHIFKISDSTYSVVNQTKNNGSADSNTNLRRYWDNILYSIPTDGVNPNPKICMPVALDKVGQYIQLFLESEYNGEVRDYDVMVPKTSISSNPVLNVSSEGSIRTPLTYKYNINLSKENNQAIYFPRPEFVLNQSEFSTRIAISDQKVYNSDIQGFDVFRVLNFFDLEENGGAIHKLAMASDNLYALQTKRITYLPTGQTQIEATDAGALSVGTGSDIGRPIVIDTERGTQHLRGVVETGSAIYIPDNENKAVYKLSGQQLESISSIGNDTLFRGLLESKIPEKNLIGVYDPVRKEYWFVDNLNNKCCIFNEASNVWVSNYEFTGLNGGVYTNQKLYLLGKVSNQFSVFEMYTGDANQLFGQTVTPRVSIVINPDEGISKTFDNQMFVASDRLATIDYIVEREQAIGNQVVSGTILDISSREGNFRIQCPRDSNSERLRGLRLLSTIKWKTDTSLVSLSEVYTKYRHSFRSPF